MRTQAKEDARLLGVLTGLAERRAEAVVATTAGTTVAGRLVGLGSDFLAVRTAAGRLTLVPLHALAWIRQLSPERPRRRTEVAVGPDAGNDESDELGVRTSAGLADVLAHAAAERRNVVLHAQGAAVTGELRAVGVDVAVVETAGEPRGLAYVRLHSLSEISFLTSG